MSPPTVDSRPPTRQDQVTMYHTVVRRKTAAVFDALNRHDPEPVLADLAHRVEHVMYGDHALGGKRHDPQTVRAWYVNRGVNVIELAWGKVTAVRIHCDTQAAAAPLLDPPGTT